MQHNAPTSAPAREIWIQQDSLSNRALIIDGSEKWPDDTNGKPNDRWSHYVEHSAYLTALEELRYYKNEFERCAEARRHFNDDLKEQYKKIELKDKEISRLIDVVNQLASEMMMWDLI